MSDSGLATRERDKHRRNLVLKRTVHQKRQSEEIHTYNYWHFLLPRTQAVCHSCICRIPNAWEIQCYWAKGAVCSKAEPERRKAPSGGPLSGGTCKNPVLHKTRWWLQASGMASGLRSSRRPCFVWRVKLSSGSNQLHPPSCLLFWGSCVWTVVTILFCALTWHVLQLRLHCV